MAVAAGAVVVGVYELALAAAACVTALFLVSPAGQRAIREANRVTEEALKKVRDRPQQAPEPKPPTLITICPIPDPSEDEPCPVCRIGKNPIKGFRPAYLDPPPLGRVPKDSETWPPLTAYQRTNRDEQGARIWKRPDGTYVHRDNLHKGMAAEIETYDRRGRHTGSICPNCGSPRGGPVPGRSIDL